MFRSLDLDKAFRGVQLFSWVHKPVFDFGEMTDLPCAMRERLRQGAVIRSTRVTNELLDRDGTVKLRMMLSDGSAVETVLLTDRNGRRTACLSTQVGCGMGCRFCRTGQIGLTRNCSDYEIVEQLLSFVHRYGRITNVVFMGMGEPLHNVEAVRKVIAVLHNEHGQGIGLRRITISTCGVVEGIRRLTECGPHVRMAFSLITADPELRVKLVPSAVKYDLDSIRRALLEYQKVTGMRITFEVVLLRGITDRPRDVELLSSYVRPLNVVVNLISWNPVPGMSFRRPTPEEVQEFRERLERSGIPTTQRYRRGLSVSGACGQLS